MTTTDISVLIEAIAAAIAAIAQLVAVIRRPP